MVAFRCWHLEPANTEGRKQKTVQLRTDGTPSTRASVSAIWGPKALDNLVDLDLRFVVEVEAAVLRRLGRTRDEEYVGARCRRCLPH